MNYIHIVPSSTQDIVALLVLLIILLAFVLVGVAVAQMALTEQSISSISIVFWVVFIMKVSVGTFGTKVMLHIRMGQQAKGGEDHHRKNDLRKIDNRSIAVIAEPGTITPQTGNLLGILFLSHFKNIENLLSSIIHVVLLR